MKKSPRVTPTYVRLAIERIKELTHDDEAAHSCEDALHQDVLRAIADHECQEPELCAKMALESAEIDFARWCA